MDPKERTIRDLYEGRARRDWDAVHALLAEEVVRHEPGEEDYSGDHRGREQVVALLAEVWFRPDGYDPDTDSAVFGFG